MNWIIAMYLSVLRRAFQGITVAAARGGAFIYAIVHAGMAPPPGARAAAERERTLTWCELGALALTGVAHAYWADLDWRLVAASDLPDRVIAGQLAGLFYWFVAIVVGLAITVGGGWRNQRDILAECKPTAVALATLGACVAGNAVIAFATTQNNSDLAGISLFLMALALLVGVPVSLFATAVALYLGVRFKFRSSESARALFPIALLIVSLWAVFLSSMNAFEHGFSPELPTGVSVLLAVMSPLVAAVFAVWELRMLRQSGGVFVPRSLATT